METCEMYAMQGKTGAVITETNIKTYHKAVCDYLFNEYCW